MTYYISKIFTITLVPTALD